jgi:hypothetical protein
MTIDLAMSALRSEADIRARLQRVCFVSTADVVASFDTSSAVAEPLTPIDSVYINRLQESLEMAGTNVCDMKAIPDAILNGT